MKPKIIVSMTTTANRIAFLKQTLASIQAQTHQPDAIELNIPNSYARADLEPVDINDIPKGFDIYRCDDYGPATKLLPTLLRYKDDNVVIIYCDDDRIYAPNWIERLLKIHGSNNGCCVGDELYDIPYYVNSIIIKKSLAYRVKRIFSLGLWNPRKRNYKKAAILEGYGGVLVRPEFFDHSVFELPDQFFPVDDIWFSAKLAERKIPIEYSNRKVSEKSQPVISNDQDIGRAKGSLTVTQFGGKSRAELDIIAMRYACEKFGVWEEWKRYLEIST